MRLQALELHGFKSFPERTKITFDAGMTVIVGPNGSGKSNISDAVKWVLGELSAKNIRGVKLEDVIFGGTDKRSPMGFAEVSLTIDNSGKFRIASDYNEITVTRRYYRTGESEYLINSKPSRLKDIVELFMNTGIGKTGYSIIGQGKISEIISQKSEDRRYIFEEAAGISKYRYKKQESERKLAETEANLLRLTDIVSVLESRVGPLEKDAEKARKYLELYEKKKQLDVSLAIYDISNIASQTEQFERSYVMAKHSLEMADDTLSSLENQSTTLYNNIELNKQKSQEISSFLSQKTEEKHDANTRRLLAEKEIEHGKSELERFEGELAKQDELLVLAKNNKKDCGVTLEATGKKLESLKSVYEAMLLELDEIKHSAADLSKEFQETRTEKSDCEKKLIDARIRLSAIESSQSSLTERMEGVKSELDSAEAIIAETQKRLEESAELLDSYRRDAAKTQTRKAELTAAAIDIEKEIEELKDLHSKTKVSKTSKLEQASTLRRMEEHFEGYQKSVKFILDSAKNNRLKGICGSVSQLIRVNAKYNVAIETALGNNIQNIVTDNEESAKTAIRLLKSENAGRATFYPLSSVRADKLKIDLEKAASFKGYIGIASSLAEYDSKYSEVIASLIGRTFVFDTLDNASEMAKAFGYTARIVTLDGQLINAGGSYTGGSAKKDSGILSRNTEIETLEKDAKKLDAEITEIEKTIHSKENELSKVKTDLDELNDGYMLLAAMYKAEETSHSLIEDKLNAQKDARETLARSEEHIKNQDIAGNELKNSLNEEINSLTLSIEKLEGKLNSLSDETRENEQLVFEKNEKKNILLVDITVAEKEKEAAKLAYDNCISDIEKIEREKAFIAEQANEKKRGFSSLSANIKILEEISVSLENEISNADEQLKSLSKEADEYSKRSYELREKVKSKTDERNLYFEQFTKLENKRSGLLNEKDKLTERLWEDYELTYTAALELNYPEITAEIRSKSASEQSKLRSKIRELGAVNVGAIEEYAQVKNDYDLMSTQIKDLNDAKEKYSSVIAQLEKEMCQKFTDTFKQVNENFMTVFKELFGGGSARLELTDPENVLTSGIEIIVSPPGKVIKNLKSLSGGEQVFVAIAILFAIFKINPPPFCLLDEIESALDEVNVSRFANYAKNFCEDTQFIVISHRRGTMEAASSLYGVTMQERGVSKLLSINVEEVEKKIGIKLNT